LVHPLAPWSLSGAAKSLERTLTGSLGVCRRGQRGDIGEQKVRRACKVGRGDIDPLETHCKAAKAETWLQSKLTWAKPRGERGVRTSVRRYPSAGGCGDEGGAAPRMGMPWLGQCHRPCHPWRHLSPPRAGAASQFGSLRPSTSEGHRAGDGCFSRLFQLTGLLFIWDLLWQVGWLDTSLTFSKKIPPPPKKNPNPPISFKNPDTPCL